MRALLNILIILIAWPALAYDWQGAPGWGEGDVELMDAFYPIHTASPRAYDSSTNLYFAKDVWAQDIANALHERAYWADVPLRDNTYWGANGFSVRWEHEHLEGLKSYAKEIITEYISLANRSDEGAGYSGDYTAWYAQFDIIDPSTGAKYVSVGDYTSTVTNPPNWTIEGFFEWSGLPTNYFAYTPARFLGATSVGFTNEHTLDGYTTLDYGVAGMVDVLRAMQDIMIGDVSGIGLFETVSDSELAECSTSAFGSTGPCGTEIAGATTNISLTTEVTANYQFDILEYGSYAESKFVAKWSIVSQKLSLERGFPAANMQSEQIEGLKTNSVFQWYELSAKSIYSDRSTEAGVRSLGTCGTFKTNYFDFVHGFVLAHEATASEMDSNGSVSVGGGAFYYRTLSIRESPEAEELCPVSDALCQEEDIADMDLVLGWEECFGDDVVADSYGSAYSDYQATEHRRPRVIWRPEMVYNVQEIL